MVLDLERALEHARKTNFEMKEDFSKYNEEANSREQELSAMCSKLKHQLVQSKKIICGKDSKFDELSSEIKRLNSTIAELRKENEDIRIDFKKSCDFYESSNKKIQYEADSEIGRLEAFVKELKESIEELMDVKNHLML